MNDKTYWNKKGKHQKLYDMFVNKLVPAQGRAFTMHGNLLRCVGNVYYDLYNNGLCNADTQKIQGAILFICEFEDDLVAFGFKVQDMNNLIKRVLEHGKDMEMQHQVLVEDSEFTETIERLVDTVVLVVDSIESGLSSHQPELEFEVEPIEKALPSLTPVTLSPRNLLEAAIAFRAERGVVGDHSKETAARKIEKLDLIKAYRELTGEGLKDSKDAVEEWCSKGVFIKPNEHDNYLILGN